MSLIFMGFIFVSTLAVTLRHLDVLLLNNASRALMSLMISLFISSVFVGIYLGQRLKKNKKHRKNQTHKTTQHKIQWLLIITAFAMTVFLSEFFITNFFTLYAQYISMARWQALWILLFIFSGVILLQAQTISLLFYRLTHGAVIREYFSAGLFCLGAGCLVGVLATQFLIFAYLNISWAVFINVCLLVLTAFLLMDHYMHELIKISLMMSVLLLCYAANVQAQDYIKTIKKSAGISNVFNLVNLVSMIQKNQLKYATQPSYVDLLQMLLFKDLRLQKQNILVLGGAFLSSKFSKSSEPFEPFDQGDNQWTFVNTNKKDQPSACHYLSMLNNGNVIYHGNSDHVWQQHYAAIIANIDINSTPSPNSQLSQDLSYQQLQNIRRALINKGVALFNITSHQQQMTINPQTVTKAIHAFFPNCASIPFHEGIKLHQVIYVCQVLS